MEAEGLLPFSQKPSTGLLSELDRSSPPTRCHPVSPQPVLILSFTCRFSEWLHLFQTKFRMHFWYPALLTVVDLVLLIISSEPKLWHSLRSFLQSPFTSFVTSKYLLNCLINTFHLCLSLNARDQISQHCRGDVNYSFVLFDLKSVASSREDEKFFSTW
jgi:hypothetical protein